MSSDDLPATVEELRELVLRMHEELTGARRETETAQRETELAQRETETAQRETETAQRETAVAQQQSEELAATVEQQRSRLEKKERQIIELIRALRGKQREHIDPDQLLLFDIGELEQIIEEQLADDSEAKKKSSRRKRGSRVIPDNLPQEEVIIELPDDERRCPVDGDVMPMIRWEVSRQLEFEPSKLKVIVTKRAVYACPQKHDEAKLLTAPKPDQLVSSKDSFAGPGLLAAVTVGKFGDHLPGYRLEDIFARHGANIHRSTIYDWFSRVADITRPLYELMKQRVLQSKVVQTDDTSVKLIDTDAGGTRTARFWCYLGDCNHPYEVYDFTETRERAGPEQFLNGFEGYLQADAYGGYDGIYKSSGGSIIEVGCWAHCRRYWHKARDSAPTQAHHALAIISRLYEVERAAKDVDAGKRRELREQHAAPLLHDFREWLDDEFFLPKTAIGEASIYTLNQWTALTRYIEDGDLSIDNNASERAMRPVAIGRKNWLFVGSQAAGERAAVLMSLIASCKANHADPFAWLRSILSQETTHPSWETLVPDQWLQSNPHHRWIIADRRKAERESKASQ